MSNIDKLMEEFVDMIIERGDAMEEGNSKKANRYFDKILSLLKKIKKLEGYSEKMKELLNHENDYVKLRVAFELLPIYTKEAENVLFMLSQKRGLVAFDAELTLERWQKGELHKNKN